MQPSAMQNHPEVIHFNAQNLANLFTFETVHLTQRECARGALRQRRETVVENFPEVITLHQFRRRRMPIGRRIIGVPVTVPWTGSFEELAVLLAFVRFLAE